MQRKSDTEKNIASAVSPEASWRLTKVKALPNYVLEVQFKDGTHGIVEMESLIMSSKAGVFAQLKDQNLFNKVYLEMGAVTWPGEMDLAPDAMYEEIKKNGKWILS